MFQHLQSNSEQTWTCEKCTEKGKVFQTYSNFQQHMKGMHEPPSFKSFCGKMFQWLYLCNAHQKECTACQDIKAECQNRPKNPRHCEIDHKTEDT